MNTRILSVKHSGFTLIELMIAMAILAILATAGLSAYTGYLKKGRDSSRAALASQVNTEVMNYAGGNGGKPPANAEEFRKFLQSAGDSLGRSAAEVSNGTILQDPLGGKEVCLDANKNPTEPCAFHYTAYTDGTYAISYGIEDPASMQTNFYKTTASVPSPTTKYGVYIGTAPYIGTADVASPENDTAVDGPLVVITSFMSPRIDIVTVSGGSGGSASGGGDTCGITICGVDQQCVGDVCTDPCGAVFCEEGVACVEGVCENSDPCDGTPPIGTECTGGALYAGPGYMTTPANNGYAEWAELAKDKILTGATSTTDGAQNTTLLASLVGVYVPADTCNNLIYGGYSDWFVPAKEELYSVLYVNRAIFGMGTNWYWSSTEGLDPGYIGETAWAIRFLNGDISNTPYKQNGMAFRCIRKY